MELSFREKGLKKETKKKILILLLIFIAALIFFYFYLNRDKRQDVTKMSAPTLPVVTMEYDGINVNSLHGYVESMDALYMRNAVVPMDNNRELPITIHTYGTEVDSISYEVRSLDTERKISEEKIKKYTNKDNKITTKLQIANLVEPEEEYLFILTLKASGKKIHYYTRIVIPKESHTKDCLTFAQSFHDMALEKNVEQVSTYLEPDAIQEDPNSLYSVSIHSTPSQVAWGGFDGKVVGRPVTELKDVTDDYTVLEMYYRMKRKNEAGHTDYFDVVEYFKVRYGSQKMYLLDYQRDMNQIFNGNHPNLKENELNIGISNKNVNYVSNETGTIVAFETAGEIYEYDENTGEMTRVFSFRDGNNTDERLNNNNHEIMLLNIDESGTLNFVVYGYMNAGIHEGVCGIGLYRYNSKNGRTEEQTFIESTKSYQILKAGFSDVLYESSNNIFYIMVDGTLLRVDLNTLETSEYLTGMKRSQYAASQGGRYFSWMDENKPSDKIHVMDLETGKKFDIKAKSGEKIKPLLYMDDDFVYGVMKSGDITVDSAGAEVQPMYKVSIVSVNNGKENVLKEYQKDGIYITDVSGDSYTIYLTRATYNGSAYTEINQDAIKDSAGEKNKTVGIQTSSQDVLGTTVTLKLTSMKSIASSSKLTRAGIVNADRNRTITVRAMDTEQQYFVYVGGNVVYSGADPVQAIRRADQEMGIVVDNSARYIWKRGKHIYVSALQNLQTGSLDQSADDSSQCVSAMLNFENENVDVHTLLANGGSPLSVLQSTLKDKLVLDLSGINLSEALYYVSNGTPVYVQTANGPALLAGYNSNSVVIFHPNTASYETMSLTDADASFQAAGNIFIAYVK